MIARSGMGVLKKWRNSPHCKPLVLLRARQVGKTALGREFGKELDQYIEINFDEHPSKNAYFEVRPPLFRRSAGGSSRVAHVTLLL